jgi:hypothetical protein
MIFKIYTLAFIKMTIEHFKMKIIFFLGIKWLFFSRKNKWKKKTNKKRF